MPDASSPGGPGPQDQAQGSHVLGYLVTLGVLVALVALVVGGVRHATDHRVAVRTREVQTEVDAAYAAVRPEADRRHRQSDEALGAALGPAVLRSSVLTCRIDSSDAGFVVQSWSQHCWLDTVDAYRTTDAYATVAAELAAADRRVSSSAVLGAAVKKTQAHGCGLVRVSAPDADSRHPGPSVVITRLERGRFTPTDVEPGVDDCHPPKPVYDLPHVRVEAMYDLAAMDPDHSWVTVLRREPISDIELGCAGLLSCDLPVSGTVLPRE